MTTFNLKNKNRKYQYLGYTASGFVFALIIAGAVLIFKPSLFNNSQTSSKINNQLKGANLTLIKNNTKDAPIDYSHIVVSTKFGKIRGKRSEVLGVKLNTFLGVPYAEPPTGKLRFKRTVQIKQWKQTKNATVIPAPCLQPMYTQKLYPVKILNYNISEDCLFLNIWAPEKKKNDQLLPVMIFIHGGMFTVGSIGVDEYDGRIIAAYGKVVMVTLQYRLGILGFLDLGTDNIPGNMGIWDQAMAIKWVHENIENFGGNPNSITLMGQSGGGVSIGLHMLSPFTKHLFQRVILQSGSPMLLNQVYTRGVEVSDKFVENVGCLAEGTTIDDAPEMVSKCIENLPLEKILDTQQEMVKNNPIANFPTIPTDYVDIFPIEGISETSNMTLSQKDYLIGFNADDGNLILHLAYPEEYTRQNVPQIMTLEQARDRMAQMTVDGGFPEAQGKTVSTVLLKGNETDTPENFANLMGSALGDLMFYCPTIKLGDRLNKLNKTVHMYVLTQRAHNSEWGKWLGVTHHDDINFVFGVGLRYPNLFHGDDIDLSKRIIKTWTHFARTGQLLSQFNKTWPLYTESEKAYMNLNANHATIGYRFHEQTCNLYEAIVDYFTRRK